jgi:hypothetical protein
MNSKCLLLLSLLIFTLFLRSNSSDDCKKDGNGNNCGADCTGRPHCGDKSCGNKDNMCYCDCDDDFKCKTSELGYKWNGGIKFANGSYALNDTKGDGKEYEC